MTHYPKFVLSKFFNTGGGIKMDSAVIENADSPSIRDTLWGDEILGRHALSSRG